MTTCAFLQRPIRFASGVFACLLLVALISRANAETPMRLDAIIGAGVLRVGLTEDYRPFSFAPRLTQRLSSFTRIDNPRTAPASLASIRTSISKTNGDFTLQKGSGSR
jgi:hypothetical protein